MSVDLTFTIGVATPTSPDEALPYPAHLATKEWAKSTGSGLGLPPIQQATLCAKVIVWSFSTSIHVVDAPRV
jgi:hypothetical protein